jgi:hypothetical protein
MSDISLKGGIFMIETYNLRGKTKPKQLKPSSEFPGYS